MSLTLLNHDIYTFILDHEKEDVRKLALKKSPDPTWPYTTILDQIKARQKASVKIPQWLQHNPILLANADTLEQASSTPTALYKASLFQDQNLNTFIDLTAGAGIDSWALSQNFKSGISIDANEQAATCLTHNFKTMGIDNVDVRHAKAEDVITTMNPVSLALIDPQRRDLRSSKKTRRGLFKFEDCSPNILDLLPTLKNKADTILIKASPMLDIDQAIEQLKTIASIHIVEWENECKEMLLILKPNQPPTKDIPITAVQLNNSGKPVKQFTFTQQEEHSAAAKLSEPCEYLYEPSPAFMKAGGFKSMAHHYDVAKLHPHTHLYTSQSPQTKFPGRIFKIEGRHTPHAKSIPCTKANLTIRNFPQTVESLRKKLKIKDGGDDYLFACTIGNTPHKPHTKDSFEILHCKKIAESSV